MESYHQLTAADEVVIGQDLLRQYEAQLHRNRMSLAANRRIAEQTDGEQRDRATRIADDLDQQIAEMVIGVTALADALAASRARAEAIADVEKVRANGRG